MSQNGKFGKGRVMVVGMDGVPYSLLNRLKGDGRIPNMGAIFDKGYFGRMSVTIPEISSVSWSSFMTGDQSGNHGIFGFMDFEPDSYKLYFPNFEHLQAPTIWDHLDKLNKKSVVVNMPATYPARKINGALISGFVATDINRSIYPVNLVPRFKEMGYRVDMDLVKARRDHDFLFEELNATLAYRDQAADLLWREVDWDLFMVVITGTDRLMHFLWDACENPAHQYHPLFLDYMRKVDAFVGRLYDRFIDSTSGAAGENHFFMLSDHGFAKIRSEVYLNRWLEENGYLKFSKKPPETIMDIGSGSTAFVMDPSRVYVNLKGRYPLGTVENSDYDRVRNELKESLEALTFDDGSRIVKKVYFKEELYQGPYVDRAPDLVILSHVGYDLKGRVNSDQVFKRTDLSGMHTQDDAFYYNSAGIPCDRIFDMKDIILGLFS